MARRQKSFPTKTRVRTKRRSRSDSFGARLKEAHNRARDRVNRRGRRRQGMTRQAAIAGTAVPADFEDFDVSLPKRLFRWAVAIALIPLCFITMVTLFQRVNSEHFMANFWRSTEFLYFAVGTGLMIGYFVIGFFNDLFLYLYVLGHEMTHAMFVYLCGGRVSDMKVSLDGGYIMTNKSNIIIALSPYFVPFWSLVIFSLYGFLSFFPPIPHSEKALLLLLGGSWTFHVIWTAWMIPKDQPDLKENGTFFSLMIIILFNLIILAALVCGTSDERSLISFGFDWWNNVLDCVDAGSRWVSARI